MHGQPVENRLTLKMRKLHVLSHFEIDPSLILKS